MIRRRRYLISGAVLATCVAIALAVFVMLPIRPGVAKIPVHHAAERLKIGMTLAEVESIFGKQATSWRDESHALWVDEEGYAGILFIDNRVSDHYGRSYRQTCNPTFFQRIGNWLH